MKQGYERSWTQTRSIRERRLSLLGWGRQEMFWRLRSSNPTSCAASAEDEARRIYSDSGCLCHHMRICANTSEFADTWEHNQYLLQNKPTKKTKTLWKLNCSSGIFFFLIEVQNSWLWQRGSFYNISTNFEVLIGGKHHASLSSFSVRGVDVYIDGVQWAPDQKNGYKGYAIYLGHGELMSHLLFYNQFLHINVCNILEIKIQR